MGRFAGCRGGPVAAVAPSPGVAEPRRWQSAAPRVPRPGRVYLGGRQRGDHMLARPGLCAGAAAGSRAREPSRAAPAAAGTPSPWPRAAGAEGGSPEGPVGPDDVLPAAPWPAPGALRWALPHLLVSGAGCTGHGNGHGHPWVPWIPSAGMDAFGDPAAFGGVGFGWFG